LEFKDALAAPIPALISTLSRLGWLILTLPSLCVCNPSHTLYAICATATGDRVKLWGRNVCYPHHWMGTLLMACRFGSTRAPRKEPRLKRMANLPNTRKRMNYERCTDERRDSTHLSSCP
ncbi:hypothetical protein H4582DRAFT_2003111, partial [Lactarius indigo]